MRRGAVPGFYVARCPWFDGDSGARPVYKVGETGDLRARLADSAYVTCFPPGSWRYAFTFETKVKRDAAKLEAAVLRAAEARRLGGTELVGASLAELRALAVDLVAALGLDGRFRAAAVGPLSGRPRPGDIRSAVRPVDE